MYLLLSFLPLSVAFANDLKYAFISLKLITSEVESVIVISDSFRVSFGFLVSFTVMVTGTVLILPRLSVALYVMLYLPVLFRLYLPLIFSLSFLPLKSVAVTPEVRADFAEPRSTVLFLAPLMVGSSLSHGFFGFGSVGSHPRFLLPVSIRIGVGLPSGPGSLLS